MFFQYSKFIFLLMSVFFIKYSSAQSGVASDSLSFGGSSSDKIAPVDHQYIYHTPLKKEDSLAKYELPVMINHHLVEKKSTVTDTLKHTATTYSIGIQKDSIPSQSNGNPKSFEQLNKRIINDSIVIQQLYKQLKKKVKEDSIAQANAIQRLYKLNRKMTTGDSIVKVESAKAVKDIRKRLGSTSIIKPCITLDVGELLSTFKFTDKTNVVQPVFTHNVAACFNFGYCYALKTGHYGNQNGLFIQANVGMRKGGAATVYEGLDVNWVTQYANASIGLGYLYNKWRLKPYFSASPYFGYLLKANETIGITNYDLKSSSIMNSTDIGLIFSTGVKFVLTNFISLYTDYKYILGVHNVENTTGKESYNRGFSFNLGIAITIDKSAKHQ